MGCPLLLLALLTVVTKAKVLSQCELAHLLQEEGLGGYGGYSLANCEFQSPVSPQPFLPGCHHPQRWQLWHSRSAFCPCPGLCMAFYESTFNTAAQSIEADGSADYGISQISSQHWCTDDRSPSDNRCGMSCRDLLSSNITDDIICAKIIVRNPQGRDAW
ncbi:LYSC1 protein, partial [Cochlearius cochlearius]|nr:LYSC1 protein [Cochlearius cochlearius]